MGWARYPRRGRPGWAARWGGLLVRARGRAVAEGDLHRLAVAVAVVGDLDLVAHVVGVDRLREGRGVRDRLAVDRGHDVTGAQAGVGGGAVGHDARQGGTGRVGGVLD